MPADSATNPESTPLAPWTQSGRMPRIAIIGAGMSGIAAVVKLRRAGYNDLTVFEKTDRVGGTWRENQYPGLSCDIPSYLYQFSFEKNPDWSHRFSHGPEIQRYMESTAQKHGVVRDVRFNTRVEELRYVAPVWELTTNGGETEIFDIVISATGVLHHPAIPDIPGLSDFEGEAFHTARWNTQLDLQGKRVGIIGTGSTSAQIVGEIADQVGKLSLFQRTAQWIHPLPQKAYGTYWKTLLRKVPALNTAVYWGVAFSIEQSFVRATLGNKLLLRYVDWACRRNLRKNVPDPVLREKLTPNYAAACKRLIFCSTFYPAISRDNAELVTDGIERIESKGVRTRDGRLHELDVLVLATGFQADRFILPTRVIGEGGQELGSQWEGSPRAHRATSVPGFPNFWMLEGPTGPIGNISLIMVTEHQIDYVIACMEKMKRDGLVAMAPTEEAFRQYNTAMTEAVQRTVWVTGGCQSWYLDKDGIPNIYPWTPRQYRKEMRHPNFREFRLIRSHDLPRSAERSASTTTSA
ncbi:NAD(P)/FAD-dependent oxidoreductase [Algiphilus sp.]|uniref:flavin-containing monooxygenase n=1 Tax=Algiphilus sp. TaxID=1872431 RepID=UPI0032EBAC79